MSLKRIDSQQISIFNNHDAMHTKFDPFANRKLHRPTTYVFYKYSIRVRSETIVTYHCNVIVTTPLHYITLHYDCNSFVRIFFTIVTISERL